MATSYLTSPWSDPGWREDPAAFAAELVVRFPGTTVREEPGGAMVLRFALPDGTTGALHRGGQAVSVDQDPDVAADVAAWWRSRIPRTVRVIFYDEGYESEVPVRWGDDGPALLAAYLAKGDDKVHAGYARRVAGDDATTIVDVRHVEDPDWSPYVPASFVPRRVRRRVLADLEDQFRRYARLVAAVESPARRVEVVLNDPRAAGCFEALLRRHALPGRVAVVP